MSRKKTDQRIVTPTEEELREFGTTDSDQPAGEDAADARAPDEGVAELRDKLLRARAELANVQRRAAHQKTEAVRFAVSDFVRDLLPAVDDFERALQAAETTDQPDQPDHLAEGARLVYENILKALNQHKVERIEAEGLPFDPAWHEAVMQQPSDEHPPQTVLQVVQQGYRLHDRLIRPAKVIVSCRPTEQNS